MKKVLFTSTALVAFAGAAAAEVTLSGWAEMGVSGGTGQTTQFFQDVDVDFTMTGEADNGLVFGADVDLDEAGNLGDPFSNQGVAIFVGGEFGTVTLGDTDSAFQYAIGAIDAWNDPGTIADDETAHWGFQSDFLKGSYDGQILRYDYTFEDFGFAVSLEQDDRSDLQLEADGDKDSDDWGWAIGAVWNPEMGPGTLNLGIAYEDYANGDIGFSLTDGQTQAIADELDNLGIDPNDLLDDGLVRYDNTTDLYQLVVDLGEDVSNWGVSLGYTMDNGLAIGGIYSGFDGKNLKEGDYWGIGAGYTWEAFTIYANYGEHSFKNSGGGQLDTEGYGLAMGYDMGGGLEILAGYGNSDATIRADIDGDGDRDKLSTDGDTYSIGLSMSF